MMTTNGAGTECEFPESQFCSLHETKATLKSLTFIFFILQNFIDMQKCFLSSTV